MAKKKTVEALPVLISSALGMAYVLFFMGENDIVLIVIFALLLLRSALGLFAPGE